MMAGLGLTFFALAIQEATASTGTCRRKWHTNIHYSCVSPGAACGTGCVCRDITNGFWSDCRCIPAGVMSNPGGCGGKGRWWVKKTGPLAVVPPPSTTPTAVTFEIEPRPDNVLTTYRDVDITPDGFVESTVALEGADSVIGSFTVEIQGNPGTGKMPVRMTDLKLVIGSIDFLGLDTGVNTLTLAPGAGDAGGWYMPGEGESGGGVLSFDEPIPCIGVNNLFPQGKLVYIRPGIEHIEGDFYNVMQGGYIAFDGDGDDDGDIDLDDLYLAVACLGTGEVTPLEDECVFADLDEDGDVDRIDIGFLTLFALGQ
jgi:hypothetical protein